MIKSKIDCLFHSDHLSLLLETFSVWFFFLVSFQTIWNVCFLNDLVFCVGVLSTSNYDCLLNLIKTNDSSP